MRHTESLKIDYAGRRLHAKLKAVTFKEEEYIIVYVPSLRISGYGDTMEEAMDLAKATFEDFCENLFSQPEHKVVSVLKELGWKQDKFLKKRMRNLSETTFEDIKREFNIPETTSIRETEMTV